MYTYSKVIQIYIVKQNSKSIFLWHITVPCHAQLNNITLINKKTEIRFLWMNHHVLQAM